MTETEIDALFSRISAGERPTEELWHVRKALISNRKDERALQSLSDLWGLAFRIDGLFPKLEAAKAIVDVAWVGDVSYPVATNAGSMYDDLTLDERRELFGYIAECIGEERASVAGAALAEFADELLGDGPTV